MFAAYASAHELHGSEGVAEVKKIPLKPQRTQDCLSPPLREKTCFPSPNAMPKIRQLDVDVPPSTVIQKNNYVD